MPTPTAESTDAFGVGSAWRGGVDLLRTSGRLLAAHWFALTIISMAGLALQGFARDLAVVMGRAGAVQGYLGLTLVPLALMLSVVGMLLVLRRRERSRNVFADLVAATGSVLVPFLVVYETSGRLLSDVANHATRSLEDDFARFDIEDVEGGIRIPEATSVAVLAIVGGALAIRALATWLARRKTMWSGRDDVRRQGLLVLAGYCEVLWIMLGAIVVRFAITNVRAWWGSRAVGRGLSDWWQGIEVTLPAVGAAGAWLGSALVDLAGGAAIALIAPCAWLALGVVVYGVQAEDVIDTHDVDRAGRANVLIGKATKNFGTENVARAWQALAEPDGRFGALLGGIAMIVKAGWSPVLVFCLLYVAAAQAPYLLWGLLRSLVGNLSPAGWAGIAHVVWVVCEVGTLMLSAVLLAAAADALLHRFGAPSALRLDGVRPAPSGAAVGAVPGQAAEPAAEASVYSDTGNSK